MFCSNCGAKANGNFCSACGNRLTAVEGGEAVPTGNWEDEIDPNVLLAYPEVRRAVDQCAASAGKTISGDEYMKILDKFSVLPISMGTLAAVAQPMFARMGVKTGKTKTELFNTPPGKVLASVFCALASRGRKILDMAKTDDGCVVTAEIPTDLWSMSGKLVVAVSRVPNGTRVEAATLIEGQYFDWGKSTRCLKDLFGELNKSAA